LLRRALKGEQPHRGAARQPQPRTVRVSARASRAGKSLRRGSPDLTQGLRAAGFHWFGKIPTAEGGRVWFAALEIQVGGTLDLRVAARVAEGRREGACSCAGQIDCSQHCSGHGWCGGRCTGCCARLARGQGGSWKKPVGRLRLARGLQPGNGSARGGLRAEAHARGLVRRSTGRGPSRRNRVRPDMSTKGAPSIPCWREAAQLRGAGGGGLLGPLLQSRTRQGTAACGEFARMVERRAPGMSLLREWRRWTGCNLEGGAVRISAGLAAGSGAPGSSMSRAQVDTGQTGRGLGGASSERARHGSRRCNSSKAARAGWGLEGGGAPPALFRHGVVSTGVRGFTSPGGYGGGTGGTGGTGVTGGPGVPGSGWSGEVRGKGYGGGYGRRKKGLRRTPCV